MTRTILLSLVLLGTGCATNLSTLQTARTMKSGQFRIVGGTGVYIPAGQTVGAIGEGLKLAGNGIAAAVTSQPAVLTNEDRNILVTAAAAAMITSWGNPWEIGGRFGIFDDLEVGARYSVNSVRGDLKYRVWHGGDVDPNDARRSYDVALGIAFNKYLFKNPLVSTFGNVEVRGFDRWDVEVPLYMSVDFNPYFGLYFVPKYVYSHTSLEGDVTVQTSGCGCTEKLPLPSLVETHFAGGTLGLRAGHPRIAAYVEITAGHTAGAPQLLGKVRDIGGATLYPAIGVVGTFR